MNTGFLALRVLEDQGSCAVLELKLVKNGRFQVSDCHAAFRRRRANFWGVGKSLGQFPRYAVPDAVLGPAGGNVVVLFLQVPDSCLAQGTRNFLGPLEHDWLLEGF